MLEAGLICLSLKPVVPVDMKPKTERNNRAALENIIRSGGDCIYDSIETFLANTHTIAR